MLAYILNKNNKTQIINDIYNPTKIMTSFSLTHIHLDFGPD